MKNFIRKITPSFLLNWFRRLKKAKSRKLLAKQKKSGRVFTKTNLIKTLKESGVKTGDTLLVHSSLSKIGYVEGGPQTVINALLDTVGEDGHVLMPNSPNAKFQLDYIRELDVFDVNISESKLGIITETFRKHPKAIRSWHPTEPVSCIGPKADYFVSEHFGQLTPYNSKSPFFKVADSRGKILMIGVTLDNAGTNLHTLEDAVSDFKFPVYFDEVFTVKIKDPNGEIHEIKTKVHNPEWSKKRKCDELIPLFEKEGALTKIKFGNADTLIIDAKKMYDIMIEEYKTNGVTMYTPKGS